MNLFEAMFGAIIGSHRILGGGVEDAHIATLRSCILTSPR